MKNKTKRSKLKPSKRTILLIILVLLLAIGGFALNAKLNRDRKVSKVIPVADNNPSESTSPTPTDSNTTNNQPQNTDKTPASASPSSGQELIKPYGSFVSNHRPSLSGANGVPSSEQSVCQGTPGAKCYIVFTKGGQTKSLPEKTIGNDGTAYWVWDVKTAGFSEGAWTIKAVSTLGSKTAETSDTLNLEVQP